MLINWPVCFVFIIASIASRSVFAQDYYYYDDDPVDDECRVKDTSVPRNSMRYEASKYPFTESGLQLFTDLEIKCNGYLVEWQFISRTRIVYALYLGVFRRSQAGDKSATSYFLVNSTHIKLSIIRDFTMPQWVSFQPTAPFPVRKGDILGIFYDNFIIPRKLLTTVSRGPVSILDKPNTYIFPVGLKQLQSSSLFKNQSYVKVNVEVTKSTKFEYREPALTALTSNSPIKRRFSTSIPTSTKKPQQITPSVLLSTSEPVDNLVPLINTSRSTAGMTGRRAEKRDCMRDEDEIVSPSGMYKYAATKQYPFLEAGLHIFHELQVPCKGYVVEWNFRVPQNHSVIYGLYLAIFRPENNNTLFRLVNATYLRLFALPRDKVGQWLAYRLSPERQMPVEQGDFLGFYYARFNIAAKLLTIATANDNLDRGNHTTWVFNYDARTLENRKLLRVKDAVKTYRQVALTAKVNLGIRVVTTSPSTARYSSTQPSPSTMFIKSTTSTTTFQPPVTLSFDTLPERCLNPATARPMCTKLALRSYFDFERGLCRFFFGCESLVPEANNFPTLNDCRALCEPPGQPQTTTPFASGTLGGSECYLPPSASYVCHETATRFYHDSIRGTCYPFYGCALINQVGNNFATMEECMRRCNAKAASVQQVFPQRTGGMTTTTTTKQPPFFIPWMTIETTTQPYYMPTPIRPYPVMAQPVEVVDDKRNYYGPSVDYDNSNLDKYIIAQPPPAYNAPVQQQQQLPQPVHQMSSAPSGYREPVPALPQAKPTYYQGSQSAPFQGRTYNTLPAYAGTPNRNQQYPQPLQQYSSSYQAPKSQHHYRTPLHQQPRSASRGAHRQSLYSFGVPVDFFSTFFKNTFTSIKVKRHK